jgi:hypothetical protein
MNVSYQLTCSTMMESIWLAQMLTLNLDFPTDCLYDKIDNKSMKTDQITTLISSMNVQINITLTYLVNLHQDGLDRHENDVVGVDLVTLPSSQEISRSMMPTNILVSSGPR